MIVELKLAETKLQKKDNPQAKTAEAVKIANVFGKCIADKYIRDKDVEEMFELTSNIFNASEMLKQHGILSLSSFITDRISEKKKVFPDGNQQIIEFAKDKGIKALECFDTYERLRALSCLAQLLQSSIDQMAELR